MRGGDHQVINIEELASSLEKISIDDDDDQVFSSNCCIFKTPKILSRHEEKAYVPNGFSFGPFHHGDGDPTFKITEKIKQRYLHGLLSRSPDPRIHLRDLVQSVAGIEKEARGCYAEPVAYDADVFVKMLVVDGCFLIELFRKQAKLVHTEQDDPVFTMGCMRSFLLHDLILLENQVPWQVLERLFDMTQMLLPETILSNGSMGRKKNESIHLVQLVIAYFQPLLSYPACTTATIEKKLLMQKHRHVLDLLRNWLILPLQLEKKHLGWQPFRSATSIEDAGIKLRRRDGKTILDIAFKDGVLEIPNLLIYETTETIFRNLISYEQCAANCAPIFTSYCVLIESLINSTKDLEILTSNQVIHCWLNPQDAVQLFRKLYTDANVKKFYYADLCCEVDTYCKHWWPKWRAAYVRNYFGTPWAIASQVLAATLLILAFLQTFYTIKR